MSAVAMHKSMTICIDGGGSKTALQVLDERGNPIPLGFNQKTVDKVEVGGTNINTGGEERVKEALHTLFRDVSVGDKKLRDVVDRCYTVAGIAGVASEENKHIVAGIFKENGVQEQDLELLTDAEMSLRLLPSDGAIVIAGTGSISLGRRGEVPYRVGGIGKVFVDKGSGYSIGLKAIQAALAEEYGWGEKTRLTPAIRDFFQEPDLKKLVPPLNSGKITATKIAAVAKIAIDMSKEDVVAGRIFDKAVKSITGLLVRMVQMSDLRSCQVHLWGGVFKSNRAEEIRVSMLNHPVLKDRNLEIVNQADKNVAMLYAQKVRATAFSENTVQLV